MNWIEVKSNEYKLFDSWAGVLEETEYYQFVIEPTKKIVYALKENITVKLVRENSKGQLICRINNIRDINSAEALKGSHLF